MRYVKPEQKFRCGDIVRGNPRYSDGPELGVVISSKFNKNAAAPYEYSVNWQQSIHCSWFPENELELIQKCLIQVRRDDI